MRERTKTIRRLGSIGAVNLGAKFLNVLALVILARLLSPHDFGLVAIAAIVTGLLSLFQDLGLSAALVQLEEDSMTARNICFWGNLASRSLLYAIAFWVAEPVAIFFSEPEVVMIIRVSAIALLIQAIGSTHAAILHRELRFGDVAKVDAINILVGTTATILLALAGLSYWSLVFGALLSEPVGVAFLWRLVRWRPTFEVRKDVSKRMLRFGKHISIINTLYFGLRNLDDIVVGKLLGALALGYYGISMRLGMFTAANVGGVVSHVMFPTYARMQEVNPHGYRATGGFGLFNFAPFGACGIDRCSDCCDPGIGHRSNPVFVSRGKTARGYLEVLSRPVCSYHHGVHPGDSFRLAPADGRGPANWSTGNWIPPHYCYVCPLSSETHQRRTWTRPSNRVALPSTNKAVCGVYTVI